MRLGCFNVETKKKCHLPNTASADEKALRAACPLHTLRTVTIIVLQRQHVVTIVLDWKQRTASISIQK